MDIKVMSNGVDQRRCCRCELLGHKHRQCKGHGFKGCQHGLRGAWGANAGARGGWSKGHCKVFTLLLDFSQFTNRT